FVAVAEAGARAFFGDISRHQSAGSALVLAGLVLVHFVADEEFAELRLEVALHGNGNAVAIEPELFDRFGAFQRFASFFVQPEVEAKDEKPGWFSFVSLGLVFEQHGALEAAAQRVGGIETIESLVGLER